MSGSPFKHKPVNGQFVGFYGCSGRLVRLRWGGHELVSEGIASLRAIGTRHKKPPRVRTMHCPSCDREHKVQILWRKEWRDEHIQEDLTVE